MIHVTACCALKVNDLGHKQQSSRCCTPRRGVLESQPGWDNATRLPPPREVALSKPQICRLRPFSPPPRVRAHAKAQLPQRNELEPRPARRHAQLPSGEVATTPLPPGRFSEPKSRAWRCPVRMLPSLCAVAPAHSMRCPRAGREPGHPLWQSAPAGCVRARQDRAGRARLIPCDTSHVSLNTRSDCLWQPCHHWR